MTTQRHAKHPGLLGLLLFLTVLAVFTANASAAMTDKDFIKLCESGTAEKVKTALADGTNANARDKDGRTALMAASANNSSKVVTALLDAGADVNAKSKDGQTALMLAAQNNSNPEAVKTLLAAGADVFIKSNAGNNALWYAQHPQKGTDASAQTAIIQMLQEKLK